MRAIIAYWGHHSKASRPWYLRVRHHAARAVRGYSRRAGGSTEAAAGGAGWGPGGCGLPRWLGSATSCHPKPNAARTSCNIFLHLWNMWSRLKKFKIHNIWPWFRVRSRALGDIAKAAFFSNKMVKCNISEFWNHKNIRLKSNNPHGSH